jgi:hypothetical protein
MILPKAESQNDYKGFRMLSRLDLQGVAEILPDDPVRPHISAEWRIMCGREVYALYEDQYAQYAPPLEEGKRAVICVGYTNTVPITESQLDWMSSDSWSAEDTTPDTAVFYTVWSYSRGAGREIILEAAKHIKETKGVTRFVTLSPLTQMAERFHLRNGAVLLKKGDECQNFEYEDV